MEIEEKYDDLPDIDDMNDMKINPDYYIHICYVKIIETLSSQNGDLRQNLLKLRLLIMTLESICTASKKVPEKEYGEKLKDIKVEDADKDLVNEIKAIKKFKILSEIIFGNKTVTTPMNI